MIPNDFRVEPASWEADLADLRAVRNEVFVLEQAVPEDEEWDEHDARSCHVIARDPDGRPIGTGRLTPLNASGRMAVLRDWRGRGVGAAILRSLLERARELHLPAVELHAQVHAVAFYARAGFVEFGEEYDECGIRHRSMRLQLAPPEGRPAVAVPAEADEGETWLTTSRAEAQAAILGVIGGARRELAVMTRDLDAELFEHDDVLEALKRLAVSTPNVRIRFLVLEPTRASGEAHRLIALAQRLTSVFAFRAPVEEIDRHYPGAFITNDRGGWYERALASRYDGEGASRARARSAQLLARFDEVWERSEPATDMRRLEI